MFDGEVRTPTYEDPSSKLAAYGTVSNFDPIKGTFTFDPRDDFNGLITFTYTYDHPGIQTWQWDNSIHFYTIVGAEDITSTSATVYIEVGPAVTVNVSVDGLTEAQEDVTSALVAINDDDDNHNEIEDRNELKGPITGENDLTKVSIDYWLRSDALADDYVAELTGFGSDIRVWTSATKTKELFSGQQFPLPKLPDEVWVEGIKEGGGGVQVKLSGPNTALFKDKVWPEYIYDTTYHGAPAVAVDGVQFTVGALDLDIDSDNTHLTAVDRSDVEDRVEDRLTEPGKIIRVSPYDDEDNDGTPNFADGFNRDGISNNADDTDLTLQFKDVILEVPQEIDLTKARIQISYDDSDPSNIEFLNGHFTPDSGKLRIWRKNGWQTRNPNAINAAIPGDFIPTGVYTPAELGITDSIRTVQLYAEGIDVGRDRILVQLDPDGGGPKGYMYQDAVRTVGVYVDLDVDNDGKLRGANDGVANYLPGYVGTTPVLSIGTSFNTSVYVGQAMKIIAEGIGKGMGVGGVNFELLDTTYWPGYAGNRSDPAVEGPAEENDLSFDQLRDEGLDFGIKKEDSTYIDFWAKDYGACGVVQVNFKKDGRNIFTWDLMIPIDTDGDDIADLWERRMVQDWNTQYAVSEPIGTDFLNAYDDNELQDPDGNANILSFSNNGGVTMGEQYATGDGRFVQEEYRGYILDGGGYDWYGANGHGGGHVRLNPAYKEFLLEVDAMAGVSHMPSRSGIAAWLNAVSKGMSQAVDGAGIRMFYVIDDIATPHDLFVPGPGQESVDLAVEYVVGNPPTIPGQRNVSLKSAHFSHLQLIDEFTGDSTSGFGTSSAGAFYAVDRGFDFATRYGINPDISAAAYISHELHHLLIDETAVPGDDAAQGYGGHFNDTNNNGTAAEQDDQTRVLWNYNYYTKRVAVAITAVDTSIVLSDVNALPMQGVVMIDNEWIAYTGISGTSLTGLTRGVWNTVAAAHTVGSRVYSYNAYSAAEMRQIRYGYGTVRYIRIPLT